MMLRFQYKAINDRGKWCRGSIIADSERQARVQLREEGLTVLSLTQRMRYGVSGYSKRIKLADLSLITRHMATLLSAGIPLDEVLATIGEQYDKPAVKNMILSVRSKVREGYTLSSALADFPHVFTRLYCSSIAAGEKSAKLDFILVQLADYIERQQYMKRKIFQALLYPIMMMGVSMSVVVFMLNSVVPKIIDVFDQTHQVLPLATRLLLGMSAAVRHGSLYFILSIFMVSIIFVYGLKKEKFREKIDAIILKLPLIGKMVLTVNGARFARALGMLTAAGVSILEAMESATQLMGPLPMRYALVSAVERVREGISIHRALEKTHCFTPLFIHLVSNGEATGQFDDMLKKAALIQETRVEALIDALLTMFEPVMILVMGAVVLFIVLAVMLPIFALNNVS